MWLYVVILAVTQKVLIIGYLSTSHKINLLTWCFLCQQVIQHPGTKLSEHPVWTACEVWQAQGSKCYLVMPIVCLHSSVHSRQLFVNFIYFYDMILFWRLHVWTTEMRKKLQEWGRRQTFEILQVLQHVQVVGVLCYCWPFLGFWIAYCTLVFKHWGYLLMTSLAFFCCVALVGNITHLSSLTVKWNRNWTECENVMYYEKSLMSRNFRWIASVGVKHHLLIPVTWKNGDKIQVGFDTSC